MMLIWHKVIYGTAKAKFPPPFMRNLLVSQSRIRIITISPELKLQLAMANKTGPIDDDVGNQVKGYVGDIPGAYCMYKAYGS
ncbi:Tic22-like family protein isoform 1 [Gossypium australe]|uniref:Tic22-like family protein isoform 1 n=1 Tax=Gossypium australe TaxID=47621 RepID=A0A5B6VWU7_9ROSI|nr:Tic22-like family protein isoform 1 [Gossypium australe]